MEPWRSFIVDLPSTEKAITAAFTCRSDVPNALIVVTASRRVRLYDMSRPAVPKHPILAIDPPKPSDGTPGDHRAVCATVFGEPLRSEHAKPNKDGAAAADVPSVADGATARGVEFAAASATHAPLGAVAPATSTWGSRDSPMPQQSQVPPCPLGAVGTSSGRVEIYSAVAYECGFKLAHGDTAAQLSIVSHPQLLEVQASTLPTSPLNSDANGSPATVGVRGSIYQARFDTTGGASSRHAATSPSVVGVDLEEMRTEAEGSVAGGADPAAERNPAFSDAVVPAQRTAAEADARPQAYMWSFTLAALTSGGNVVVLEPQPPLKGSSARNRDAAGAPLVQRTVLAPYTLLTKAVSVAASGDGVLYYANRHRRVTCISDYHTGCVEAAGSTRKSGGPQPTSDVEDDFLKLPSRMFASLRCVAAFRHLAIASRGAELITLDFRSRQVRPLVADVGATVTLLHVSYPLVVCGCNNGAIVVVSLLSKTVIGRTATYAGKPVVALEYSWARGILVVSDATGAVDLLQAPAAIRTHARGPLNALASGRVLRRAVELERSSAGSSRAAKTAEVLVLERMAIPDSTRKYLGANAVLR